MCQLADDFLLCSCGEADLTDPDWILERLDENLRPLHRRGRAMIPRFNDSEQKLQQTAMQHGKLG